MNTKTCKDCPCRQGKQCRLSPPKETMQGWDFPMVETDDWCYRGREIMERDGKLVEVKE